MRKKLLCGMLVLTLMLPAFSFPASSAEKTTDGYDVFTVVSALGIMNQNLDKEAIVTRAEAVGHVLSLLNITDYYEAAMPFSDVPREHTYFSKIAAAVNVGFIRGDQGGTFRPDAEITLNESLIMILRAMGYDLMAVLEGGTVSHYYNIARRYNLLRNVSASGAVTNGQFAQLIYNTFNMGILEQVGVYSGGGNYSISETKSSLFYRGLTKIEGIITENGVSSIHSTQGPAKIGSVVINGQELRVGDTKAEDYLGYNAEVFVDDGINTDNIAIRYIFPKDNTMFTLNFEDTEFSVSNGRLSYLNDGRSVSVNINPTSCMIVNGVAVNYDLNYFLGSNLTGTVTFLNSPNTLSTAEYNVIFINTMIDDVVKGVDVKNGYIYIKNNMIDGNPYIDLPKSNGALITIIKNGAEIDLSDIAAGNVISCSISANFADIYVSDRVTNGIVREYESGSTEYVTLNNIRYPVSGHCGNKAMLEPGREVTVYINYKGVIVDVQRSFTKNYGYVMKTMLTDGIVPKGIVRLLNISGLAVDYHLAEKITRNDESRLIEHGDMITELEAQKRNNLIVYNLNESNEINNIWFAEAESGNIAVDEQKFVYTDRNFGSSGLRGYQALQGIGVSDTYLFSIPDKADVEADECRVAYNSFIDYSRNMVRFYDIGRNGTAKVVLIFQTPTPKFSVAYPENVNLIEKISTALDAEGALRKKIYYYRNGAPSSVFLEDDPVAITTGGTSGATDKNYDIREANPGDIITWETNNKGRVDRYSYHYNQAKDFNYSGMLRMDGAGFAPHSRAVQTFIGYLDYYDTQSFKVSFNDDATFKFFTFKYAEVPVTVFNTAKKSVRPGTMGELYTASPESGAQGVRILARGNRDVLSEVIIYE